jgi:hypothetical protein
MLKIIIVSSSLITLIATNNLVMAQQADSLKLMYRIRFSGHKFFLSRQGRVLS